MVFPNPCQRWVCGENKPVSGIAASIRHAVGPARTWEWRFRAHAPHCLMCTRGSALAFPDLHSRSTPGELVERHVVKPSIAVLGRRSVRGGKHALDDRSKPLSGDRCPPERCSNASGPASPPSRTWLRLFPPRSSCRCLLIGDHAVHAPDACGAAVDRKDTAHIVAVGDAQERMVAILHSLREGPIVARDIHVVPWVDAAVSSARRRLDIIHVPPSRQRVRKGGDATLVASSGAL